MRKFLFVICVFANNLAFYQSTLFEEQNNLQTVLGAAGERGNLRIASYVGQITEENFNLPVQLEYSSDNLRGRGRLPSGWSIPLFDSFAVAENENTIRVLFPSGHELYFVQEKNGGRFVSLQMQYPDGHGGGWSITEADLKAGRFVIENKNGLVINFKQGRIDSIGLNKKPILRWKRTNGVDSVQSDSGREIASISSVGDSCIMYVGKDKIELDYKYSPSFLGNMISAVTINGKLHDEFSFSKSENLYWLEWKNYEVSILPREKKYSWLVETGVLQTDSDYEYKIELDEGGCISKVTRTSLKRKYWESFSRSTKTLKTQISSSLDQNIDASYMITFGGRLRKAEYLDHKRSRTVLYSYDENGRMLRAQSVKKGNKL